MYRCMKRSERKKDSSLCHSVIFTRNSLFSQYKYVEGSFTLAQHTEVYIFFLLKYYHSSYFPFGIDTNSIFVLENWFRCNFMDILSPYFFFFPPSHSLTLHLTHFQFSIANIFTDSLDRRIASPYSMKIQLNRIYVWYRC